MRMRMDRRSAELLPSGRTEPLWQNRAAEAYWVLECLTRISHQLSTSATDPGMSTALRSVGLLDVLSSTSAGPSVARLVSAPVCAASLRNLVRNAG